MMMEKHNLCIPHEKERNLMTAFSDVKEKEKGSKESVES